MNKEEKAKLDGIKAKQLLNDPLVIKALADMRHNLYDMIQRSSFDQSKEREDCYYMLRAVESFEGQFKKIINAGIAAEQKIAAAGRVVKRIQEF